MRRPLVAVIGCLFVSLAALSGAVAAADNPGLADFDPRESEVAPGETVEIDLTMQVVSTNDEEAVESIAYEIAYDPDVLSVVDIEQGPWLQGGEETQVTFDTETDNEAGRLTVEEAREPAAGGVIGDGTTATVTFEVDPGAPASKATVEYDSYEAQMLEYPLPTLYDRTEATIIVTDDPTDTETDDQPGFGPLLAVGALLFVTALARVRQAA